jgi:hypothetical protein
MSQQSVTVIGEGGRVLRPRRLGSAQRTRYHKECDPRKRRCVVQEVGDHYREQAAGSPFPNSVPQGRLKIGRDAILDNPQPSLRDGVRKSRFSRRH